MTTLPTNYRVLHSGGLYYPQELRPSFFAWLGDEPEWVCFRFDNSYGSMVIRDYPTKEEAIKWLLGHIAWKAAQVAPAKIVCEIRA